MKKIARSRFARRYAWRILSGALLSSFLCIAKSRTAADSRPVIASAPEKPTNWSDRSYYLAMRDGVRLAVSWYFPDRLPPVNPAPVLLVQTRYGRARSKNYVDTWLQGGYVAAVVDVRGSTASFGSRDSELGSTEQSDMDEIIAHVAKQPWSNGKVVASGISYLADAADLATTRKASALVAAIPREADLDNWAVFWPGGIPNDYLFLGWSVGVYEADFGRPRTPPPSTSRADSVPWDCRLRAEDCPKLFPLLQPVDEDADYNLLREALNLREKSAKHWTSSDYANVTFRDDKGLNGNAPFDAAGAHLEAVRREKKPVQYWGSWIDANTGDSALSRYLSTPLVPSVMIITANNHVGDIGGDPFFPERRDPIPSIDEQNRLNLAFSNLIVRSDSVPTRTIQYYVLGAGVMRETPQWPPRGVRQVRFSLDANGRMTRKKSVVGLDSYEVDFTATTGQENRWTTGYGASPAYGDRREEDRKLITYDSTPMSVDAELVGWPVVTLRMRTKTSDPAIFAYLEDVAPDGRVTYITEAQIRATNRKLADRSKLPYYQGPAAHSFNRSDALPIVPGEPFTLKFKLNATAALIKRDHRLRLAIAGADADSFRRLSTGTAERFDIYRGGGEPSVLEVPLRSWR